MARPRTPTKLLEMRGSYVKHPERRETRANEPKSTAPLGDPPEYFGESEASAWQEIAEIAPCNVLSQADRLTVELTAVLLGLFRKEGAAMESAKFSRLQALLGSLGMSPADRSRVKAFSTDDANPFDALDH